MTEMFPKRVRRTRVLHLLVSGAAVVVRQDAATLRDQMAYITQVCTWVNPLSQTSGVSFDFAVAPGRM